MKLYYIEYLRVIAIAVAVVVQCYVILSHHLVVAKGLENGLVFIQESELHAEFSCYTKP